MSCEKARVSEKIVSNTRTIDETGATTDIFHLNYSFQSFEQTETETYNRVSERFSNIKRVYEDRAELL